MSHYISKERKFVFYLGIVLTVIGVAIFFSVFLSFGQSMGRHDLFEGGFGNGGFEAARARQSASMIRAFIGVGLAGLGGFLMRVGRWGLAGSGMILDLKRQRRDYQPYSHMAGQLLGDVLQESGLKSQDGKTERVVMIKCRACQKLNEEDSKFCQECGFKI